jgi:hypothetical protein
MKMNKQRTSAGAWLLSCVLLFAAVITMLAATPVTAEAAEVQPISFSSEYAYMTGVCKKGETPSGDVVIPGTFTYKGVKYKVIDIDFQAFYNNTKVTSVTIPSTVKTISKCAFVNCTKLKTVTISKKAQLSSIGDSAFSGCTALKEIYINAETVGEGAFLGCTSLSKVTFGDNVKEIGYFAFVNTAIQSITFGKNITTIDDEALWSCSKLETITIGENVTTLGENIAYGCGELEKITIKSTKLKFENCGDAGSAPFGYLSEDVKITVPDGKSEEYGFLWTDNWVDEDGYVRFAIDASNAYMTGICEKGEKPSGAVKIPATFTYDGVNYKIVKIQKEITGYGDSAFYKNEKITSVEIPSTVTEIGSGAFEECSKLKTVTMSKKAKLSLIGSSAFSGCTSLKEIYINAETVGLWAFSKCSSLAKVTFGDNVKEIGQEAFMSTAIKSIDFGKNITTVGTGAVSYCQKLEKITIGENVTTIGYYIDGGSEKVKTITVKSTKLNADTCGSYFGYEYEAPFINSSKKETIKVPKKKLSAYKKILGEGESKKITYKTF